MQFFSKPRVELGTNSMRSFYSNHVHKSYYILKLQKCAKSRGDASDIKYDVVCILKAFKYDLEYLVLSQL